MLCGIGGCSSLRVGHRSEVTDCEHSIEPGDLHPVVHGHEPTIVGWEIPLRRQRRRALPCGPHDGVGAIRPDTGRIQPHHVVGAIRQPGVQVHLNLPSVKVSLAESGQARIKPGKQRPLGLDQHPAKVTRGEARIPTGGVAGQALQLGEGLHPGISPSDEGKGEQGTPPIGVLGRRRGVELMQHPIAQPDRVSQRLEPRRRSR